MKTEDLENGSDVFVMLEALYENSIEEAKTKNTHVTSVPAGASEKEFAKARAANPYRVRLGKGVPAGAKNEETEIEEAKAKIKYLTGPGKRDSKRIIGIYTMQGKWIKDMNTEKEAMNFVNKSWGESVEEKVKNIEESASKAALEDFMYALPKAAIEELRPVMKMKQGVGRMAKITAVLKKHGITQKFMGAFPTSVVNDYFDTFHGESVELESDGINESMNNYLAFYNGKKITVQAETSYKAQLKAIEMFKAPASKKHMVNVKLAGGGALANNESVEEAYAHPDEKVIGQFYEKTGKKAFEYRMSKDSWGKSHDLPHEVCVSRKDPSSKGDWRAANVKGTVCYIAVDEGEGGKPVIEKWDIKKHVKYVKAD